VCVHVVDGLAGMTAGVEDHSVPAAGDAIRGGDLVRLGRYLGEQTAVGGDGGEIRVVLTRDYQNMGRRLRIYVAECESTRAF
jgi:hypothetical protein